MEHTPRGKIRKTGRDMTPPYIQVVQSDPPLDPYIGCYPGENTSSLNDEQDITFQAVPDPNDPNKMLGRDILPVIEQTEEQKIKVIKKDTKPLREGGKND